ncbi:hypothetical protein BKA70DRAFT_1414555, partial [Coprinopsis sp. MPI-PUGE-AT-0042]
MHSSCPPPRPRLPQSLLDEVSAGSSMALFRFIQNWKKEHYNLNVLEAILSALQTNPKSPSLTQTELAFRELQSVECLQMILAASLDYPALLEATRSRTRTCLDDILGWVNSSIHSSYTTVPDHPSTLERNLAAIANSIMTCLSLKGAVLDDLVQHPALTKTLLWLWSAGQRKDPRKVFSGVYMTGISPILAAFKLVLGHKAGFQAITECLIETPGQLELFCKASCARFMQIPDYINNTILPVDINDAKSNLFFDTLDVTTELINNPVIRRALFKAGYVGFLTVTIARLASVFSSDVRLDLAAGVIDQCLVDGSNPCRNLQTILDHGYINLISDALLCDLKVPYNQKNALHIMSSLEAYTYYPQVATSLWNALDREPLQRILELRTLSFVGPRWNHLVNAVEGRITELETIDAPAVFCDNSQHHDWSLKTAPRSCSGCHLVVYCSRECQSEDWNNRHRKECASMRSTYTQPDDRNGS